MAAMVHQFRAAAATPLNLFKRQTFMNYGANGESSTPPQKTHFHAEEEEETSYHNTRCLSSYHSIFAARLAIMVMLAILIGMLTLLTWHFTKVYTASSINSLAYGLRYELLQRPILRMWNILNATSEITMVQVKLSEYVIGRYEKISAQNQEVELYQAMGNVTWALFSSKRALNAITISYSNGFAQAFHREHRSNNTFYIYSELASSSEYQEGQAYHGQIPRSKNQNLSILWYRETLDPTNGQRIGDRRQIPPDDLINIACLPDVRDGAASWHVTVSKFTDSPLLSAALPVRHPSEGSIVAAVGVTTALKSVGRLMRELVDIHSGYMYLTSREGYVLATSTDAPLLKNTTTGLKLMMASDSEDHIIRAGAEWLQRAYGTKFPISHEIHVENVLLGDQRYYIDSFFLDLKRLPLVGVIIIPRKYIMGKADQIGFTTFVILISASIGILAIGCVCILILTSGVSKAMKLKAELISHLDARRRAEASSNYKSQFLANMSHELRTPMAAVIGLLDILIYDGRLTNDQFETLTQIHKCSTALLRLLNNILDLSKVESGKLVLEEAEFDLGRELEGLVDLFSVQCINQNVETILDLSDEMPKVIRGDSARIVQIFTNLISNSIKFTSEGYIILRGWCESSNYSSQSLNDNIQKGLNGKMSNCALKTKSKQHESTTVRGKVKKDIRIKLWFEVEDTGCGIDPSKWESVFESFEQADPSTTRKHGGTGLGLCIVRNLVNKMGGEIKIVKKEGPGTLMQLYLVLGVPEDCILKRFNTKFQKQSLQVLLALRGRKSRFIMSQWLMENGIFTWEASDWSQLTQILRAINVHSVVASDIVIVVDIGLLDQSINIWNEQLVFLDKHRGRAKFAWIVSHDTPNAIKVELRQKGYFLIINKPLYKTKMRQILEAVVKEEEFEIQNAWNLEKPTLADYLHESHDVDPAHYDTVSSDDTHLSDMENPDTRYDEYPTGEERIKRIPENRHPSHWTSSPKNEFSDTVFVDKILKKSNCLLATENSPNISDDFIDNSMYINRNINCPRWHRHEEAIKQDILSSMTQKLRDKTTHAEVRSENEFFHLNQLEAEENIIEQGCQCNTRSTCDDIGDLKQQLRGDQNIGPPANVHAEEMKQQLSTQGLTDIACEGSILLKNQDIHCRQYTIGNVASRKKVANESSLGGLYILLAEDNPILQRVATVMLEKNGAKVFAVGDGQQAVDATRCMLRAVKSKRPTSTPQDSAAKGLNLIQKDPPFDLILMDCQMPKLDGYEATKAIRELEAGTGYHIPIVAVTAHAMSSDEAKCLDVGMDAYLTKPIDCKLMVSAILSLTQKNV